MAGKLFPTTDPEHAAPLRTASFITQQDIGGDYTNYINDVELRNAPNTSGWRRGSGVAILLITGAVFSYVDREPAIRQLYEVAELGKPTGQPTRAPAFMRLLVAPDQPRIDGEALDFRDEIMRQVSTASLTFAIEVTDDGEARGPALAQRRDFPRLATHRHPDLRHRGRFVQRRLRPALSSSDMAPDRNDPSTATRVGERKQG